MNTKHTPGPWTNNHMQDTIWANDGDTMVARITNLPWKETPSGRRTSDCETEYANARLIAAAPELLAALQKIDANAAESAEWIRRVCREAIARATGE